jgi:WD40 repeat protein
MENYLMKSIWFLAFQLVLLGISTFHAPADAQERHRIEIAPSIGHVGQIRLATFSPNGAQILSGAEDKMVKLWDTATGRLIHTLEGHRSFIAAMAFSRDGALVATAGPDEIKLWDAATGQHIRSFELKRSPNFSSLAFSPDGSYVLSGDQDGAARLWDRSSGQAVRTFQHGPEYPGVNSIAYSSDGTRILTAGRGDKVVKIWDAASGELLQAFGNPGRPGARDVQAAMSPDGTRVLVSADESLTVWDTSTGTMLQSLEGRNLRGVRFVEFSTDGARIFAGGYGWAGAWNAKTGRRVTSFEPEDDSTKFSAISADGNSVLSIERTLTLWDLGSGQPVRDFTGIAPGVTSVAVAADGSRVLSGAVGGIIGVWDTATARTVKSSRLNGHFRASEELLSLATLPSGPLAISRRVGTLSSWNADTGQRVRAFKEFAAGDNAVLSADGARVVALTNRRSLDLKPGASRANVTLWDTATGEIAESFDALTDDTLSIAVSADRSRVVCGARDGTVRVFDTTGGGRLIQALESQPEYKTANLISAVALSPDSRFLLAAGYMSKSASDRAGMRLWDLGSGKTARAWEGEPIPHSLVFLPDGKRAVAAGSRSTFSLWDVMSGKLLRTFQGHAAQVTSLAVSPDGRRIFSGSHDGTTRIWDADTGGLLASLIVRENADWLAVTPEGFYDASAPDLATGVLTVASGLERVGIEGVQQALNRPDLLREKLRGDPSGKVREAAAKLDLSRALANKDKPVTAAPITDAPPAAPTVDTVAQMGHAGATKSMALSPDGRLVLTGGNDKMIKLWDAATGRELRSFTGHRGTVDAVAFSPDSRFALSGSDDDTLRLWDVTTGKELRSFAGHRSGVMSIAFSSNGQFAVSGSWDKTVKLWDVAGGKLLRSFDGHREYVEAVAFSPDRLTVLSAGVDKTIKLWDVATGTVLRSFDTHRDSVEAVAFSPDGKWALSGSKDKTMKLWEVATGRELRSFQHGGGVTSVAFSSDGRTAIAGSSYERIMHADGGGTLSTSETITLWNLATGEKLRSFGEQREPNASPSIGRVTGLATRIAVSPDNRLILSDTGGTMRLWDAATGKPTRLFIGHGFRVRNVAFSPDGRIGLANLGGGFKLWNVGTGTELRRFGKTAWGSAVAFTPDGRFVLSGTHGDFERQMMDDPAGRTVALSPDGRSALSASGWALTLSDVATGKDVRSFGATDSSADPDNTMKLWDLQTGKELRSFAGHTKWVTSVAFSPDGRFALSGGRDRTVRLWDVATGGQLRSFEVAGTGGNFLHHGIVVAFSPDGKRVLSGNAAALETWDIATGKLLSRIPAKSATTSFSRDGRLAATADFDEPIGLWNLATGEQVRSLSGHTDDVEALAFSPDGRLLLSGGNDGTIRVWAIDSGRELARSMTGVFGEWIVLTPEGFFSGSYRDTDMLAIVRGLEVTTIGQIHQSLFSPDLVREALAGDTGGEVKRAAQLTSLEKVLEAGPAPKVTILAPQTDSSSNSDLVTVRARVTDGGKGVGRIEWRVNNVTAKVMHVPEAVGPIYPVQSTLALDPGKNRIEVLAYERRNLLASQPARATINFDGPADRVKPKLHILAIGINAYVDEGWTPPGSSQKVAFPPLNLAVPDAKAFGAAMQQAGDGLYGEVSVTAAFNADARADNLDRLVDLISTQVAPRDTFVLYAAAHGITKDGRFYLIPQDFQGGDNPEALAKRAIGQDHLQDWVANRIRAKKALILLDTCESGALVSGYTRSRTDAPASEAAMGRLHEATGRPVLTAAASGKPAFEGYKGHGVFTFALIDALHRGDSSGNGMIELSELVAHVQGLVPKLSAEISGGAAEKGVATIAMRGFRDDKQSAHFGSTGEDFALVSSLRGAAR